MSRATPCSRAIEVPGRSVEKHIIHKNVTGHRSHAHAAIQSDANSSEKESHHRDDSPHVHAASARHDSSEKDQDAGLHPLVAESAAPELATPSRQPAAAKRPTCPALPLDLDVCPSFSEQRPQGAKPLFLERHNTLQSVYELQQGSAPHGSCDGGGSGDTQCGSGSGGTVARDASRADPPASCLPGWDIARSELWLLAEAALLRTQPPPPPQLPQQPLESAPAGGASADAGMHAGAGPAAAGDQQSDLQSSIAAPAAAAPGRAMNRPLSAFAFAASAAASAAASGTPEPERVPPVGVGSRSASSPFACRNSQVSITLQAPGLGSLFSSTRRACPPTPRGMGPLPSLLTPSFTLSCLAARPLAARSGRLADGAVADDDDDGAAAAPPALQSQREAFVVADPGPPTPPTPSALAEDANSSSPGSGSVGDNGSAGESGSGSGGDSGSGSGSDAQLDQQHQQQQKQKHHAAFAAGVAAATSTAAAVSHAAAAAAAGLAGIASQPSVGTAAGFLMHLGGNMLNVGTSVLATKVQGPAMSKSTMHAAEAVLGPDAPEALRQQLRQRLRYTLAGASVMWFLLNLHHTTDVLAHLDFEHDFVTSSKTVLNLAVSGPTLLKNCEELLQVGIAVTLGVGKRAMGADGA
ncbi:hypothetical protein PLESTB_000561200 [Pleodorina starrii]|uniref:Uncharacterized protein n=1 Tax=Pleodorina starrii TaxID=330485 RepID=A0A9W6BH28_9CHLO|nr:hypothetical protein PLESTM_000286300 [Pleodorina starrii]GLC51903.1 hypothetical protein PLESTB_000561200 [Pleodorina starrii]GLC74584.1 hypothetical protein PLESTF_001530000 [Pleodorina starrii]